MNKTFTRVSTVAVWLTVLVLSSAPARALEFPEIKKQFPENEFIIGVGEVKATGNKSVDRRMAEILARLEIAKQIRVRVESEMVDAVCEGAGKMHVSDCRNEVVMVIKQTVDEVLGGSKIVQSGEKTGTVYAVAVMPKSDSGGQLEKKSAEAAAQARESLNKAGAGDHAAMKTAKERYLKALSFQKEAEALGMPKRPSLLNDLEKELEQIGN